MFSTLRNRFGIPGVISVIALVFAMFGGAYAASNSSGGGKATASAKGKPGPRGKTGKTGPAGPAGPAGPQGPAGANGKDGANGTNGTPGSPGAPGQSVKAADEPPLGNCGEQEGVKLTSVSGTNYVCDGADGEPGSPWAAGGTLPVGSTETGAWDYAASPAVGAYTGGRVTATVSFPIPLAAALDASHVVFVRFFGPNPDPTHCNGTPTQPKAASGYLCVYESILGFSTPDTAGPPIAGFDGLAGASTSGAKLNFHMTGELEPEEPEEAYGFGTFAVTG